MIEMIKAYFVHLFNKSAFAERDQNIHYDQVINGSYNIDNIQIDKALCINGQARLGHNAVVQKSILVNGEFIAQQARVLSDLTVNGSASIEHTKLEGNTRIRGCIAAKSITASKRLEILSSKATFNDCTIQGIIVKGLHKKNSVQKVMLAHNSVITGDIIFGGGHGEVLCDVTSKIEGVVIGGTLIPTAV